jgi:hypothetical protein
MDGVAIDGVVHVRIAGGGDHEMMTGDVFRLVRALQPMDLLLRGKLSYFFAGMWCNNGYVGAALKQAGDLLKGDRSGTDDEAGAGFQLHKHR